MENQVKTATSITSDRKRDWRENRDRTEIDCTYFSRVAFWSVVCMIIFTQLFVHQKFHERRKELPTMPCTKTQILNLNYDIEIYTLFMRMLLLYISLPSYSFILSYVDVTRCKLG